VTSRRGAIFRSTVLTGSGSLGFWPRGGASMKKLGMLCRARARQIRSRVAIASAVCAIGTVSLSVPALAHNPTPAPASDKSAGQDVVQTIAPVVVGPVITQINSIISGIQANQATQTNQANQATQFSVDGLDELGIDALSYSGKSKRARIQSNPLYKA